MVPQRTSSFGFGLASSPNGARSGGDPSAPLVLFATGSTGGHVTPALAVAEALRESGRPINTLFVGPPGGIAEHMVAAAGGAFAPLEIYPLRGGGAGRWARGFADLPFGMARSLQRLRASRPDVVMGFGAHVSGPIMALAALHRIPTLLFEANVDVGLANLWLKPIVQAAAVAWPQTRGSFPREFLTGWPVARTIRESARNPAPAEGRFQLLVLGGSAGAPELDLAMREALPHLRPFARHVTVVHQASKGELVLLRDAYRHAGVEALVEPFFEELEKHYRHASLVISRAGAATLSELAAVGLPAILVPLAAAGDHQQANARAWEAAGAARLVPPEDLTGSALAAAILALVRDLPALARMSSAARSLDRPDAATRMAQWCLLALHRG
jgi:UDP-N-acetylglucosamine--N-acetylmuramyl-(pentapeptide) pyrophosphoryl-undecaprenol N-acetylglucosamine transferase